MVFKKRTAPKRKMIQRKRMARHPRVVVNRALHPIPQRFITKMKYSEILSTDGNGQYRMNLNSIFDPNRTGTGHQPYAFDTLATLYNRYRVISCGYRISTYNNTSGAPVNLGAIPSNEELSFFSFSELRENPRAKYISQSFGGGTVYLSGKTYIPSLVGRTKSQYMSDDRYQAQVNGSPNELAILNIVTVPTGTDIPGATSFQILMEYTVEFFDIKHLVQS